MAESGVKQAKQLLKKCHYENTDFYEALLEMRNTELLGINASPAQLLMSRRQRTKLPISNTMLKPKVEYNARNTLMDIQKRRKIQFDKNKNDLSELKIGQNVYMLQNSVWVKGVVVGHTKYPRSYLVKIGDTIYRRNRIHLREGGKRHTQNFRNDDLLYEIGINQDENNLPTAPRPLLFQPEQTRVRPHRTITKPLRFNDYI